MADSFSGTQRPSDSSTDFNAINAAIRRILTMGGAPMPAKVTKVSGEGLSPVGFVSIELMVHQQDGRGRTVPRGTVHNVPYCRLQGGTRAFICDPAVGDIGIAIICGRDISNVKDTRSSAAPGSYRQNDYADAVYLGGMLNGAPEEYCGWIDGDFHVKTKGKFVLEASECDIQCAVKVQGAVIASGDVKADAISLQNHKHTGVQPGSGTSGAPE